MKKLGLAFSVLVLLGLTIPTASATTIGLFDYGFNIDGTTYIPSDSLPGSINLGGFNTGTGLGNITITITGTGAHSIIGFFDHEIDEADNTFFNEYGDAIGAPIAGQSWEIDEPGYVFGDIYDNFLAGALDNTNNVPSSDPEDVSMAVGWDFTLEAGEIATITFYLKDFLPVGTATPAFYLQQTDPDSPADIYLYSNSTIRDGDTVVPEPGTLVLVLSGLGLAVAARVRKSV